VHPLFDPRKNQKTSFCNGRQTKNIGRLHKKIDLQELHPLIQEQKLNTFRCLILKDFRVHSLSQPFFVLFQFG
jgi:hypothetical protein